MVERDVSERIPDAGAGRGWEPASLARRFGALLLDWIACLFVSATFAHPLTEGWAPVFVLIVEYGFFLGLFGQTPGMFITRLRCVAFAGATPLGRPIGIPRALLRGVLLALVVPALLMDENRRGVHDRLAGSIILPA